jgi:histidinol-phosphate/aromatic aminotransferase/cobyric acid decarboxylase-like protein
MIKLPPAGPHGGDGARVAQALGVDIDEILDLSQSLNPVASDPRPFIAAHLDAIGRYPDPEEARQGLATKMGVDPGRLLLTNGGAEAIALIAAEIGGSVQEPEFSLHPRGSGPRWRSNPHSPSGLLAAANEKAAVWDEAFYPLATGEWTRGDDETIVVGSLTKLLACPGLRIGYILGDPAFIQTCSQRQPEWALNGLAAAALPEMLKQLDLAHNFSAVQHLRQSLRAVLESHGLVVRPSDANWLLVQHATLRELLAPYAIVVRDCSSFGLTDVTRIAVPNDQGLARLNDALDDLGDRLGGSLDLGHLRRETTLE